MEIDIDRHYDPTFQGNCNMVLNAMARVGDLDAVMALTGMSYSHLIKVLNDIKTMSYQAQVMMKRLAQKGDEAVNIGRFRNSDAAIDLIDRCIDLIGSGKELERRIGMSNTYIHMLRRGERRLSYRYQVLLEALLENLEEELAQENELALM